MHYAWFMKYFPILQDISYNKIDVLKISSCIALKVNLYSLDKIFHYKENNRYSIWLNNTLNKNTIRCKELATIVSSQKYVARPFVRQKREAWVPKYSSNVQNLYVIIQSVIQSCLKTPFYGASLQYRHSIWLCSWTDIL